MTLDEAINRRYSCRAYQGRPVKYEDLLALCEAARMAPSACNSQTWRFILVRDAAQRKRLCDEAMMPVLPNKFLREAPVIIVGCSKLDIVANRIGSGVTGIEYYPIDMGIAMEHMALKAADLGLGTCWIGWFKENKVKDILEIPRAVRVLSLLSVGYPKNPGAQPKRSRKKMEEFVFGDRWDAPFSPGQENIIQPA